MHSQIWRYFSGNGLKVLEMLVNRGATSLEAPFALVRCRDEGLNTLVISLMQKCPRLIQGLSPVIHAIKHMGMYIYHAYATLSSHSISLAP